MASYDYYCRKCDKVFEIQHGMMEAPEIICPECKDEKLIKQITGGTRTIFVGDWYCTTYGKKSVERNGK